MTERLPNSCVRILLREMAWRYLPLVYALAAGVCCAQALVEIHEDKLTLSTWNEGPPDPDPQFSIFHNDEFPNYPYTIRTPLNRTKRPEQWREIVIENEYLRCRVLPDLGGHLYGCTDKIVGREIFYANPAYRPGGENGRNGFFSTGIESSFPIAHSRVTTSPVDYAYSIKGGIGRVVVEDTDRVSGMQWRVEFILRPGVAVLEQHVTLHNGSTARRAYHWWANASIELDDPHLRFVYPARWMLPHGDLPMTSWPLDSHGTDLGDVASHKDQVGLFAHGSFEPWMAVYKPKFRVGVAHYADSDQVRGKKLWLFGDVDKVVKETRTENFNSYVEMQAGLFETQPEFQFLIPGASVSFTHYWIPFHGMGGVSRATPDAVVDVGRTGNSATIELEATHPMNGVRIRVSAQARILLMAEANLEPRAIWSKTLEQAPAHLAVDVLSASGQVVFRYVEGQDGSLPFDPKASNPEPVEPSGKLQTEAGYLGRGIYYEQHDELAGAWREFLTGLAKFPSSVELLRGAGRVASILNRYDDAVKLLAPFTAVNPWDAASHYYYGVALARTGSGQMAKAALAIAARDSVWMPAANLQLAALAAREGDMATAVQTIQALAADPRADTRTGAMEVAILRRGGKPDLAKRRLQFWLDADPANNLLKLERVLLEDRDDPDLWVHLAADPERVLDLVDQYLDLGATDDALKLLERHYPAVPAIQMEMGKVLPQDNPLIAYYRGYCRSLRGQDGTADFKLAESLSSLYIFPHRASSWAVLKGAVAANKSDAVAHNLMGELYFDSLDTDRAIAEWKQALALKRDLPALHRNLGRALIDVNGDIAGAKPVLLEGATMTPGDMDLNAALDRANRGDAGVKRVTVPNITTAELRASTPSAGRMPQPQTQTPPPQAAPPPATPADSIAMANVALVRSTLDAGGALSLFTPTNFPREKQPDAVRRAYAEVRLQWVLGAARAGKCGEAIPRLETIGDEDKALGFTFYGLGQFMKAPHFQYYVGVVQFMCGGEKEAKKTWGRIPKAGASVASAEDVFPYLVLRNIAGTDAKQKIAAAIEDLKGRIAAGDANPELFYAEGELLIAAGRRDEGLALLGQSSKAPDPMIQYLSLTAININGRK
jgi:tetratricopeptide (TPR) repeat protein